MKVLSKWQDFTKECFPKKSLKKLSSICIGKTNEFGFVKGRKIFKELKNQGQSSVQNLTLKTLEISKFIAKGDKQGYWVNCACFDGQTA